MPTGWSPSSATAILNGARGGTAFTLAAHYIQLHSADPGPAGTSNVLNNGTRALATFAAASGNSMASNVELTYTNWQSGTTGPTHFTDWSAATGGTFQASGTVTLTSAPSQGATATIASGALVYSQAQASA